MHTSTSTAVAIGPHPSMTVLQVLRAPVPETATRRRTAPPRAPSRACACGARASRVQRASCFGRRFRFSSAGRSTGSRLPPQRPFQSSPEGLPTTHTTSYRTTQVYMHRSRLVTTLRKASQYSTAQKTMGRYPIEDKNPPSNVDQTQSYSDEKNVTASREVSAKEHKKLQLPIGLRGFRLLYHPLYNKDTACAIPICRRSVSR